MYVDRQTDRQTDRETHQHTDTIISVLRMQSYMSRVNNVVDHRTQLTVINKLK